MRAFLRGAAPPVAGAVPTSNTFPRRMQGTLRGTVLSVLFFALLIGGAPTVAAVDPPPQATGVAAVEQPSLSPGIAGTTVIDPLEFICMVTSPLTNPVRWLLCKTLGY